jgi:hypothetical protein
VENFSYLRAPRLWPYNPQDVMPRVELLQQAMQLAVHPLVLADSEDLGDLVGGEAQHPQLTGALENLGDGERAAEDEVPAVLDLVQRVSAPQLDGPLDPSGRTWVLRPQSRNPGAGG